MGTSIVSSSLFLTNSVILYLPVQGLGTCVRNTLYTLNTSRHCQLPTNKPVPVTLSIVAFGHVCFPVPALVRVIIKSFPFLSIQQVHK